MTTTETGVYVVPVTVDELFVDPEYQRVLDVPRARGYAAHWDRRLAGILEVSDRGDDTNPRYAIIDGQHRWAAAKCLTSPPLLVANVHEGLTIRQEAELWDKFNRERRRPDSWAHWRARRAAGNQGIIAIDAVCEKHGLIVDPTPKDGCISAMSTLEKIVKLGEGETKLLDDTLQLITMVWSDRRDAVDAAIVHGVALILYHLNKQVDPERLVDTLMGILPRQLKTNAAAMRELSPGTMPVCTAIAIMTLYNKKPGGKLLVSHRTFGGTGKSNNRKAADA